MILVDSSVLIRYARTRDPVIGTLLNEDRWAVAGVTRAEMLHGARTDLEVRQTLAILNACVQVEMGEAMWDIVGANLARIRRGGIVVSFPDAVLATIALERNCEVWSVDRDFAMMQGVFPKLRLFAGV